MTYNEYLPAVIQQVSAFMDLYKEEFQQLLPYLPQEQREHLREQYRQSVEYLFVLKQAMDERRNYASVCNLDHQIAQVQQELARRGIAPDRKPELEQRLAALQRSRESVFAMLSPESQGKVNESMRLYGEFQRAGTQKDADEKIQQFMKLKSDHIVNLDNRLLDILKGNPDGRKDLGIPQNFLPQRTYLQAIQLRYEQLREIQIQVSKKKEWSEQHRAEVQKQLSEMRRTYMDNIVMVTQQLAGHHVVMAELTSIQNHFGRDFNLSDARNPTGAETPKHVLEVVDRSMDGARDFRLGRLQAMLTQVDKSFDPNGFEQLKDAGIMKLLETVNGLSGGIRNLITALLPEGTTKTQIDAWLNSTLPLAIQESLETGVGPDGKPLTKEEKLQRIRDVIIRFRDTHAVEKYRTTVTMLQGMPDASKFAGEQLVQPLPQEEIRSAADRDRFIQKYNGATVYSMLIRQMKGDGEVFDQAYKNFLGEMENLVDIRLGLIAEANMIKEGWKALAWALTGAAGGAVALVWITAAVGSGVAMNLAWKAAKAPLHLLRGRPAVPAAGTAAGGTTVLGAAGRVGGGAALGYKSYLEFRELGEMKESIEKQRTTMVSELLAAGFAADPPNQEETFRYKDGGTEIVVNLKEINEAQRGQESAQALRSLTTAAEALAVLRFGLGRAFLPLVAVEVSVEIVRYGMDQEADRKFVLRAPAWVLAKINMEEATGDSAYDILAKASGEMMTDSPFNDAEDSKENREKHEMREKMLFAILHRELREFPELRKEVYGGSEHGMNLKHFYENRGGFKDVFLPAFYSRLFELTGNGLSWEDVSRGQIDNDWNIPLPTIPKISLVEIRRAMRETIIFFIQHEREEEFLVATAERDRIQQELSALQDTNTPDARRLQMRLEILQDMVRTLGQTTVFGQKLAEADYESLRRNNGKTRAQVIAGHLLRGPESRRFTVSKETVHGMPSDFSFGKRGDIFLLQENTPAFRATMDAVVPQTIHELEGSTDPEWVYRYLRPILGANPAGLTHKEEWRKKTIHAAEEAVELLRGEKPTLTKDMAEDAIRMEITRIGLRVATEHRSSRTQYRKQGRENYPPFEFRGHDETRGDSGLGEELQGKEAYEESKQIAKFTETFRLKDMGEMCLSTFIFGDPTDLDKMYVVQKANVSADMATVEAIGRGFSSTTYRNEIAKAGKSPYQTIFGYPMVMTARDFMAKEPGGRQMMLAATTAYSEHSQRIREQFQMNREKDKEKTTAAHLEARKDPGAWKELPSYEKYKYVAFDERNGYMYLDMPTDNRYRGASMGALPDPDRVRERENKPPVEIRLRSGRWFLGADYRGALAKNGAPVSAYEDALSYPLPNDRFSLQKILTLYVRITTDVCERAEEELLPLYRKMKTKEQKQLFLRTLNNLIQQEIPSGNGDWSLIFRRAHNRLVPEMERRTKEIPAVLTYKDGTWRMDYSKGGKTYEIILKSNGRDKSGGTMYYPNRETDSITIDFREKNTEGTEVQWTVWGYEFFSSDKFPQEIRNLAFDVITTPYENGIAWHNMDKIFFRFPHDISANSKISEACEHMFRSSTNQRAFLRGLFEVIERNGAEVTETTTGKIIQEMQTRYERGDFDAATGN